MTRYQRAPVIRLRKKPISISEEEFREVFKLDKNKRPLNYIENDFEDQGEAIIDHATGLLWQKAGSNDLGYKKAQAYIEELNRKRFAGYMDWRLPTIEELVSLLEPEKQSNGLYINPIFHKTQTWCWSADKRTKGEGSSAAACYIYFGDGDVIRSNLGYESYVRAVRS